MGDLWSRKLVRLDFRQDIVPRTLYVWGGYRCPLGLRSGDCVLDRHDERGRFSKKELVDSVQHRVQGNRVMFGSQRDCLIEKVEVW